MEQKTFVIADTHFGHKNIIKLEAEHRPFKTIEEHDTELIARWNAVVTANDVVWHLGDVLFGKHSFAALAQLKRIKRLVMGNHDLYPAKEYLHYFNSIYGCFEAGGCILTHMPVHESQFERYRLNIHGHLHTKPLADQRYICVSAEQLELQPTLLYALIENRIKGMEQ